MNGSIPACVGTLAVEDEVKGASADNGVTAHNLAPNLAPNLALTGDRPRQALSNVVTTAALGGSKEGSSKRRASGARGKRKARLSTGVSGSQKKRAMGVEPTTFSLEG